MTNTILAIDPGSAHSGWCYMRDDRIVESGKDENGLIVALIRISSADTLAIEMIESMGMPVGREVFETCVWIGRFIESWHYPDQVKLITRRQVKLHLCNSMQAKDSNIRQAIIDRFPPSGGGTLKQVGTKLLPGPLYGVHGDAWSAVGVALTAKETINNGTRTPD